MHQKERVSQGSRLSNDQAFSETSHQKKEGLAGLTAFKRSGLFGNLSSKKDGLAGLTAFKRSGLSETFLKLYHADFTPSDVYQRPMAEKVFRANVKYYS